MNEKKILKFDLQSKDLQVKNLLNQEFLNISIKAISSANPNRNKSHFTPDSLRKAVSTCYNKPILAHFMPEQNDFGAHDDNGIHYDKENDNFYFDYSKDSEVPIGLIRQNDKVEVIEENGLTWLNVSAALWVQYNYKACKRLLKDRHKKVSVEVEVNSSYINEQGVEVIEDFTLLGISVLGSAVTEAIPGASLDITDLKDNPVFSKQFARLQFAYKQLEEQNVDNKPVSIKTNSLESQPQTPDFQDPVEIEKDKEITMDNTKKGGENVEEFNSKLTNNVLSDLLSSAICNHFDHDDHYCWLADFDGEFVYYCLDGIYFQTSYTIDTSVTPYAVNIAFDQSVPVVRTWNTYSDTNDSNMDKDTKITNAEHSPEHDHDDKTCPDCGKPMDQCECKKNNSCEDKQVEEKIDVKVNSAEKDCNSTEEKECNSESEKECNSENSDPDKQCESSDECPAEEKECNSTEEKECNSTDKECNSTDPEDGSHVTTHSAENDPEKECNSAEDKECNSTDEKECNSTEEKECNSENTDSEKECNSTDNKECNEAIVSPDVYSVNGENISGAQLYEKFCALQFAYNELNSKYINKMQDDYKHFAFGLVDEESDLSADNVSGIKAKIGFACAEQKFSSQEDIEEFTTSLIANALYSQKKEARKNKTQEFSYDLVKNQNNFNKAHAVSDAEELKNLNQNLKNI